MLWNRKIGQGQSSRAEVTKHPSDRSQSSGEEEPAFVGEALTWRNTCSGPQAYELGQDEFKTV